MIHRETAFLRFKLKITGLKVLKIEMDLTTSDMKILLDLHVSLLCHHTLINAFDIQFIKSDLIFRVKNF